MQLSIRSQKNKEVIDITEKINSNLSKETEAVLVFVKHTTAALAVSEVGEGTGEDFAEVVEKIIPKINFRHGHNPSHAPDHMIGSLLGPNLVLPVANRKLDLGTWQKVVLLEENGPRNLEVVLNLLK